MLSDNGRKESDCCRLCLVLGIALVSLLCVPAVNAKSAKDATPTDCYTSYNAALYYAKDAKSLASYFTRARQSALRSMNPQQQAEELKKFKSYYISGAKLMEQKITGNTAHVKFSGVGLTGTKTFNATVDAQLQREDNYWKVDSAGINGVVQLN